MEEKFQTEVRRNFQAVKLNTRMTLTRKTTLGHVEKDPEEGAVSYRAYVPPSSFSPQNKQGGVSSAFAGKTGTRFNDHQSHYRKTSSQTNVPSPVTSHRLWKAKGGVSIDKNPSPRFGKGGIYKKAQHDHIGLGHSKSPRNSKGANFSTISPRRTNDWLKKKGNSDGEGESSLQTASVRSSFNTKKKGTAFAGPVGKRFEDHHSHLKGAKDYDRRELSGHAQWIQKQQGKGQYDSDQKKRFEGHGAIYKESLTDHVGLTHSKIVAKVVVLCLPLHYVVGVIQKAVFNTFFLLFCLMKGAVIPKEKRGTKKWLKTKGREGDEGEHHAMTSPLRSDFDKAKDNKSPSPAFAGKIASRFSDHHSHLKDSNKEDSREHLGHQTWKTPKGLAMASTTERFSSYGSIYKKNFKPIQ